MKGLIASRGELRTSISVSPLAEAGAQYEEFCRDPCLKSHRARGNIRSAQNPPPCFVGGSVSICPSVRCFSVIYIICDLYEALLLFNSLVDKQYVKQNRMTIAPGPRRVTNRKKPCGSQADRTRGAALGAAHGFKAAHISPSASSTRHSAICSQGVSSFCR